VVEKRSITQDPAYLRSVLRRSVHVRVHFDALLAHVLEVLHVRLEGGDEVRQVVVAHAVLLAHVHHNRRDGRVVVLADGGEEVVDGLGDSKMGGVMKWYGLMGMNSGWVTSLMRGWCWLTWC